MIRPYAVLSKRATDNDSELEYSTELHGTLRNALVTALHLVERSWVTDVAIIDTSRGIVERVIGCRLGKVINETLKYKSGNRVDAEISLPDSDEQLAYEALTLYLSNFECRPDDSRAILNHPRRNLEDHRIALEEEIDRVRALVKKGVQASYFNTLISLLLDR